jgi:hypothetical protein
MRRHPPPVFRSSPRSPLSAISAKKEAILNRLTGRFGEAAGPGLLEVATRANWSFGFPRGKRSIA